VHSSAPDLSRLLLTPEEAARLDAHGRTDAAVLVPMYGWPDRPGLGIDVDADQLGAPLFTIV